MAPRDWKFAGILAVAGLAVACAAATPAGGPEPVAPPDPPVAAVSRSRFTRAVIPASQRVTLTFEGPIDGSDRIVITPDGARWENVHWGIVHGVVKLNGVPWEPRVSPVLVNDGKTRFLPPGVELARARLVSRTGRDYAGIEPGPDGLVLRFVDSPNGAGPYRLVVEFE